jgi:hypothetical protein
MTADISRHSLRPAQKFTGVVRQQGRLPIDAEETEAGDLASLMLRQAIAETICARGSPNRGFRIREPLVGPPAAPVLDFTIEAGSFYLGGARCGTDEIHYRSQPDWLSFDLANPGPSLPAAGASRTDLVWLQAEEITVTATEDAELFERALGGADSGARRRLLPRVRVLEDVPASCAEAFADLIAREFPGASLDAERCELVSGARLRIGFTQLEPLQDLCRPSAQAGFLGARNETFRVQINRPGHFVWGRDNAAPLYRVQVTDDAGGERRRLQFLTPPRDEFGWPLAGMTVELLPWGAALDNTEKAAEPRGLLLRVLSGFDPATESIEVTAELPPGPNAEVPADWETWLSAASALNPRDPAGSERYFFLRVWTGGGTGNAFDHPIDLINPVPLGDTGLTVNFSGSGLAGDYWIISARPNTPTEVTPWALLDGMPPVGPRRWLAPLALLPWTGPAPGTPIDCRHRFRSLCRNTGCCVVVVGDERQSHGDVSSIQDAIDSLPAEGGTICVLPGYYDESVHIRDRRDIRIHGCDARSRLRAVADDAGARPGFLIEGSQDIAIEHMGIEAGPRSAVEIVESSRIALRDCVIQMRDEPSLYAAIFARGEDLLIARNLIDTLPRRDGATLSEAELNGPCDGASPAPPAVLAHASRGGIQLGGGCERVEVVDNAIRGGVGNGITLGSLLIFSEDGGEQEQPDQPGAGDPCDPCRPLDSSSDDEDDEGRVRVRSAGDLYDIEIRGNRIEDMGANGISVVRFFALRQRPILITVHGLHILHNRIERCLRRPITSPSQAMQGLIGYGGIALAVARDLRVLGNDILRNGSSHLDPVCGIFAVAVQGLQICDNRILDNGPRLNDELDDAASAGNRGGIWIWLALPVRRKNIKRREARAFAGLASVTLNDNSVVVPLGRCVTLFALGPVTVGQNRLLSQSTTGRGLDLIATNTLIANFGISNEWTLGLLWVLVLTLLGKPPQLNDQFTPCEVARWLGLLQSESELQPSLSTRWATGKTLLSGNQISTQCLQERELGFAASSVLVASLDDVGFTNNQVEIESTNRFFLTDLAAIGGSVRVADNRLSETWMRAFFSGLSAGLMNTTTDNQTTHCLIAASLLPGMRVFNNNLSLVEAFCPNECGQRNDIRG